MFYCDTATHAYENLAIQQAVNFFGEDRVLFGTDAPMDVGSGALFIDNVQRSLQDTGLSIQTKQKIARENILRLFD